MNKSNTDCYKCYIATYRRFLHILLWLPPFIFVLILQLRLMISLSVPSSSSSLGNNPVLSTFDVIKLLLNPVSSSSVLSLNNNNDNNLMYTTTTIDTHYYNFTNNTTTTIATIATEANDTVVLIADSNNVTLLESSDSYVFGNSTNDTLVIFSDEGNNLTDYTNSTDSSSKESKNDVQLHIVFSTGCSPFQDWQSYAFFYHIWRSGQTGDVTRIVSGCNRQQQTIMENDFQKNIIKSIPSAQGRFHLHFTPEYSRMHLTYNPTDPKTSYKFFNKPFGLKHWMEQKLGYRHSSNQGEGDNDDDIRKSMDNTIIVILDPDQLVLKPFIADYTNDVGMKWHIQDPNWSNETMRVLKGRPFSQLYGMGTSWVPDVVSKVNETINRALEAHIDSTDLSNITTNGNSTRSSSDWVIQNISFYMNRDNHLPEASQYDYYHYYNAGPPYIGVASDMFDIVTVWSDIVVPVYYASGKAHLAEMFAYSAAAAYLGLRHQLAYSFMVSNMYVSSTDETWGDDVQVETNDTYFLQWSNPNNFYKNEVERQTYVPYVFHYCQEYSLGPYHFFKYYIPNEILTCSHPMLLEPPSRLIAGTGESQSSSVATKSDPSGCGTIAFQYNTSFSLHKSPQNLTNQLHIRRNAYALCQVIYRINDAIEFWKDNSCIADQNQTTVNYNKTWIISELRQAASIQI